VSLIDTIEFIIDLIFCLSCYCLGEQSVMQAHPNVPVARDGRVPPDVV
jgi:hypothetical protein